MPVKINHEKNKGSLKWGRLSIKKLFIVFFILSMLISSCPLATAQIQTDSYSNVPVSVGSNTIELDEVYNGEYVTSISGNLTETNKIKYQISTSKEIGLPHTYVIKITKKDGMTSNYSNVWFEYENGTQVPIYKHPNYNSSNALFYIYIENTQITQNINLIWGNSTPNQSDTRVFLKYINAGNASGSGSNYTSLSGRDSTSYYPASTSTLNLSFLLTYNRRNHRPTDVKNGGLYIGTASTPVKYSGYNYTIAYSGSTGLTGQNDTRMSVLYLNYLGNSGFMRFENNYSTSVIEKTGPAYTNTTLRWYAPDVSPVYFRSIYTFKTTNATIKEIEIPSQSRPITINIPSGNFSSVNFNSEVRGRLDFNVTYRYHAYLMTENDTIFENAADLAYEPKPQFETFKYLISNDTSMNNVVASGTTTGGLIKNIPLSEGNYYWRMESTDGDWISETRTFKIMNIPNIVLNDGNHFWGSADIISDTETPNAEVVLNIPHPYGFSGEPQSYRFYDIFGNLLEYNISGRNSTVTTAQVKLDVNKGPTYLYYTAGNASMADIRQSISGETGSWTIKYNRWVMIDSAISGIYLSFVDGINGEIIKTDGIGTNNSNIGGSLIATNLSSSAQIKLFFNNTSISYANNVKPLFGKNGSTFDRYTSVLYYDTSRERGEIRIISGNNNIVSTNLSLNRYEYSISNQTKFLTIPITRTANSSNVIGIYGQAVDMSGRPIENATVEYRNAFTGAVDYVGSTKNGGEFGYANLTGNTSYYITISKEGYGSNQTTTATKGVSTAAIAGVVVLTPKTDIQITVVDSNTNETINYFTTYLGDQQTIRSTDNGTVRYRDVEYGEKEVIILADGYNQVSRTIYVDQNSTSFVLKISKEMTDTEFKTPLYTTFFTRNNNNIPIQNVRVSVYSENGTEELMNKMTGTDGGVTFLLDRTLSYRVEFTYGNETETIHVSGTQSTYFTVFLNISTPGPDIRLEDKLRSGVRVSSINETAAVITATIVDDTIGMDFTNNVSFSTLPTMTQTDVTYKTGFFSVTYTISRETYDAWAESGQTIVFTATVTDDSETANLTASMSIRKSGSGLFDIDIPDNFKMVIVIAAALLLGLGASAFNTVTLTYIGIILPILVGNWITWINVPVAILAFLVLGLALAIMYDMRKQDK